MTHCDRCDADVDLVSTLTQGGIVLACPRCEAPHGKPADAPPAPVKSARADAPAVTIAPRGGDVVEQVRARLAAIDVELERLGALRTERKRLAAMLRAAERTR